MLSAMMMTYLIRYWDCIKAVGIVFSWACTSCGYLQMRGYAQKQSPRKNRSRGSLPNVKGVLGSILQGLFSVYQSFGIILWDRFFLGYQSSTVKHTRPGGGPIKVWLENSQERDKCL